ncbi:MAG: hypothetical protein VR70_15730 [Rhodospirillaceae bacterium BRH_c57]|nr:MAG: hypothetical protein VR70_15730 [Rhodospirillaceae bacterium BRH_c57]
MITILIPTINRSAYVWRALETYKKLSFSGTIFFGDSSDGEERAAMDDLVARYAAHLDIRYKHVPREVQVGELWQIILDEVTTPYVTYAGDDDLQFPSALDAAVRFLEENDEYIGARCDRIEFSFGTEAPFSQIRSVWKSSYREYESPLASERLSTYIDWALSLQYTIFRTSALRRAYGVLRKPFIPYFSDEFIPCGTLAALGRIRAISMPGTLFQIDGAGGVWKRYSMFDLIVRPEWPTLYANLLHSWKNILIEKDGLSGAAAEEFVRRMIWSHVQSQLYHQYQVRHVKSFQRPPTQRDLYDALSAHPEFPIAEETFKENKNINGRHYK